MEEVVGSNPTRCTRIIGVVFIDGIVEGESAISIRSTIIQMAPWRNGSVSLLHGEGDGSIPSGATTG